MFQDQTVVEGSQHHPISSRATTSLRSTSRSSSRKFGYLAALSWLVFASAGCQYNDLKAGGPAGSRPGSSATTPGTGSTSPTPSAPVVDYQLVRQQIFVPHCLRCHSAEAGGVQRGGVALNTFALAQPIAALTAETIETDFMPLRAPPLSPELKAMIRAWVDGGAVEVAPASGVPPSPPSSPIFLPEAEEESPFLEGSTDLSRLESRSRLSLLSVLWMPISNAAPQVTPPERKLGLEESRLEFLAIGRPSFLKIRGEGAKPEAEISVIGDLVEGVARVDLRSLKTGIELRDQHMHERYAQTDKYPTAELKFKISDAKLGERLTNSRDDFESGVTGRLFWREKDHEVPVKLRRRSGQVEAEFSFLLTDYGVELPHYAGIKVADEIQVKVLTQLRDLGAKN